MDGNPQDLRRRLSAAPSATLAQAVTPHYTGDYFHCPRCLRSDRERAVKARRYWLQTRGRGGPLPPENVRAIVAGPQAYFVDETVWRCGRCTGEGLRNSIEWLILGEPRMRDTFLSLVRETVRAA